MDTMMDKVDDHTTTTNDDTPPPNNNTNITAEEDHAIQQWFNDDDTPKDEIIGTDSDGRQYSSIEEMWSAQGITADATRQQTQRVWYDRAADYYETNCPPTLDGVLGGFASISPVDLQGSRQFLTVLADQKPDLDFSHGAAAECGAGIGRVTKGLLLSLGVTQCDLVESSEKLLCEAPDYIGSDDDDDNNGSGAANKCRFYHCGLQEWNPRPNFYSIIWIQWVLCYLTDDDIVAFLKRCAEGLIQANGDGGGVGGVIILKENTCGDQTFVVDTEDASVCRSLPYWLKLVKAAGLRVILQKVQTDFPDDLFPVPMLALEPAS